MKKRVYSIVVVLIVLLALPLTAAPFGGTAASYSKFALGLNLGTNTGLGFQYRANRDFDVIGNLGLNDFGVDHLSFDVAANYKISGFEIDRADFDVTMGLGTNVGIPLQDGQKINFALLVPFGVMYHFMDVPIDVYLRLAPGFQIVQNGVVDIGFDMSAFIGALWRFD